MIDVNIVNLKNNTSETAISMLSLVVTGVFSYLMYRLQKQQNNYENKEKKEKLIKHCYNIYYLLSDLVDKLVDPELDKNIINTETFDEKSYFDDINFLRYTILDKKECDLLMQIIFYYKGAIKNSDNPIAKIKSIYKIIIDRYIDPVKLIEYKIESRIEDAVSVECLMIIYKLQKALNSDYKFINTKMTTIEISNKKVILNKKYDNGYISYCDGVKNGYIHEYESVFHGSPNFDSCTTTSELIYKGEIHDNYKEGKGEYFYYPVSNTNCYGVNSVDLSIKNINFDENAQKIKSVLIEKNITTYKKVVFEGLFKNNVLNDGIIKYVEYDNTIENEIRICNGIVK